MPENPPVVPHSLTRGWSAAVVFLVSLVAITAELFFGLMISLKAFSHMVYVAISFALLGYGVGSTLRFALQGRLGRLSSPAAPAAALAAIAISTFACAHLLPHLPIRLSSITSNEEVGTLAVLYITVAFPFVGIGFLIAHLFTIHSQSSGRLYFWDLLGAGAGAFLFYPIVSWRGPLHGLAILSAGLMALGAAHAAFAPGGRRRWGILPGLAAAGLAGGLLLPEPDYEVDTNIGWECIPKHFAPGEYRTVLRRWSPLGRTDLYEILDPKFRPGGMAEGMRSVLGVNYKPDPDLSYFSTNHRAGTPVHALSDEAIARTGSKPAPFTEPMELPYVLLREPRVLVIGTGGGRDLHMAKVHGAVEVAGAEINPVTFGAMSPGGEAFEYSRGIYASPGVRVLNTDGRHLAALRPSGAYDLVILNGIDTFAALSTGAFAYAENYLYTMEALREYLRILSPGGVLNLNRWLESPSPRESLRLFVMVVEALRNAGVAEPRRHLSLGRYGTGGIQWGLLLVKKTPFTREEHDRLERFYAKFGIARVFSPMDSGPGDPENHFEAAMSAFERGRWREFIDGYWADISPVHDDSPFFYKYYRFSIWPSKDEYHPAGGTAAFRAQTLILVQTAVFILLFIGVPLAFLRRRGESALPPGSRAAFVLFFSGIGLGYILIEIALMQRFTLVLGSPIHAISVTLAVLLISSGIGSVLSGSVKGNPVRRIAGLAAFAVAYALALAAGGSELLGFAVGWPLGARLLLCAALIFPPGVALGMFFPVALTLVGARHPGGVSWAWGINSGFTVLGSTLAIMIAQFTGFTVVFLAGATCYVVAAVAFAFLHRALEREPV